MKGNFGRAKDFKVMSNVSLFFFILWLVLAESHMKIIFLHQDHEDPASLPTFSLESSISEMLHLG